MEEFVYEIETNEDTEDAVDVVEDSEEAETDAPADPVPSDEVSDTDSDTLTTDDQEQDSVVSAGEDGTRVPAEPVDASEHEFDTYEETYEGSVVDPVASDYSVYLENISSLLLFLIFFLGLGCGLISARIMWGRVK